jgi:hypothetical protein
MPRVIPLMMLLAAGSFAMSIEQPTAAQSGPAPAARELPPLPTMQSIEAPGDAATAHSVALQARDRQRSQHMQTCITIRKS